MKNFYLLTAVLFVSGSIFGQRTASEPFSEFSPEPHTKADTEYRKGPSTSTGIQKSAGDTIFYEDFANGLAGNNGVGAWTTGGPDGALWLQDFDGPGGDFSDPAEIITSTTAANGFMIFDSNLANDGCAAPCTVRDGWLISPTMDLSATPYLHLVIEQAFRWCCSDDTPHFIDISSDGGATWPTRVALNESFGANVDGPTNTISVNIGPGIAADPSMARFRISHDGSASGNVTHYHWQIDDISLVESPTNNLELTSYMYDEWFFDLSADFSTLEFATYPSSQVRPLTMKGNVLNDGTAAQSNVTLDVEVTDDNSSSVFSGSDFLASLAPSSNDSIYVLGYTPSGNTGRFTVDFTLSSDSIDGDPSNNVGQKWFEVSDYIFARDTGSLDNNIDNQGEAYEVGNWFNIQNNDELLYGIDVAIDDASDVGTIIGGILYDSARDPIEETDEYEITSSDLNGTGDANFVTLLFSSPVDLFQGEDYLITVVHFGGQDNVVVGTSGRSPAQTSSLYDNTIPDWFYITNTPMVRMNFNPSVGIEDVAFEHGIKLGQNFPNPFGDMSQISFEVDQAMEVTFEIHDLTGKLVHYTDLGKVIPGNHTIDISASELGDGVYFYSLTTNTNSLTKRMVILDSGN